MNTGKETKTMTEQERIRMDYELAIGNAERTTAEVQETLDNLMDLIRPLREEIDKTAERQLHWIGAVDTVRNICSLLSHELDELQNHISMSKSAVKKLTKGAEAYAGKES